MAHKPSVVLSAKDIKAKISDLNRMSRELDKEQKNVEKHAAAAKKASDVAKAAIQKEIAKLSA